MDRMHPSAWATSTAFLLSVSLMGQTAYPDHVVQGETWSDGVHHVAVTQKILSAGDVHEDMLITGTADAEFVSGTSIHLTPDFHAGAFTGNGLFHAYINPGLGPDGDVVLIAPDPATAVVGNLLQVPKWEKLEIGLQLPQEYQDAIDRFFAHYYSDPLNSFIATPGNVDPVHDLNPYADDSLQVVMTLTRPDGTQTMRWGFFMREAKWADTSATAQVMEDLADPLHPYHIRFRLAPDMEGPWQFTLAIKAPHTTTLGNTPLNDLHYTGYSFVCEPPLPDNHGPLHVNEANRRTLQFEDGIGFFGLGVNMHTNGYHDPGSPLASWADTNSYRYVRKNHDNLWQAMESLHGVGGNFMRMFQMDKGFAPENVNLGVYDRFIDGLICWAELPLTGNGQYQCWAFDQLLDHARNLDLYIQLCLVPYPPIIDYQSFTWGGDAYLHSFVAPREASGLYNMKRYFYSEGDTANTTSGAFYYWKRKYKYILSRWGWSVNMPILEPFNEIDQMLTYRDVNLIDTENAICDQDKLHWVQDTALPATYSQWLTDIISYVKREQDLNNPAHSPLGYGDKLFLTGTGPEDHDNPNWENTTNPNWNLPNKNPHVDLVDVHHGMFWGDDQLAKSYTTGRSIRDAYTNSANGAKRPFHQGEYNYYQLVDINPIDTVTDWYDAGLIFCNYDISFHNELWASTFFGNFASGTTWQMGRVFWWEDALPQMYGSNHIPYDIGNIYDTYHSGVYGATNLLKVGPQYTDTISVRNLPVFHNLKPLADFLFNPNLQALGFFDGEITPHKQFDATSGLETYYLTNADSTMAIGWVHNLNAYWEKQYYVTNVFQNFFGCTEPDTQEVALPGFTTGLDYHITWFPTRMNDTIYPPDAVDTSGTGTVLLDMNLVPLGDTLNKYLDTLHVDYAFIIALSPVLRNMVASTETGSTTAAAWDFSLYPNPARERIKVAFPDTEPRAITIFDLQGRKVLHLDQAVGPVVIIPTSGLGRGTYCVHVSDGTLARNKLLVIQ